MWVWEPKGGSMLAQVNPCWAWCDHGHGKQKVSILLKGKLKTCFQQCACALFPVHALFRKSLGICEKQLVLGILEVQSEV